MDSNYERSILRKEQFVGGGGSSLAVHSRINRESQNVKTNIELMILTRQPFHC